MLFWTMQITLISIILIFLIHHLLVFFKDNLTSPKIKDLIYAPTQKYEAIFNAMNNVESKEQLNNQYITLEELIPTSASVEMQQQQQDDPVNMKNELKLFMKKQFKENSTVEVDSSNSSIQYSSY